MTFKDWFFEQFPEWHQVNDSNLDANGEGTFKRYLRIYGLELDENIVPYIDNFLDIVDVQKTDDKYLPLVAQILGAPPSIGTSAQYRKLLSYIVAIYKVKGTVLSYKILFNILGLNVDVVETKPKRKITYDAGYRYDDGNVYDSFCEWCTKYKLAYSSIDDTNDVNNEVPEEVVGKISNLVCLIQPIDAKFQGVFRAIRFNESSTINITESNNLLP